MELGEKLKARRKELGLTLEQVGNFVGVSKSTVRKWETGFIENMKRDKIALLAKILRVSPLWVMGIYEECHHVSEGIVRLPIVGRLCCGNGALAFEDIEDYEPTPKEWLSGGDYFYLRAKGDSMTGARIHDGDLLLIRKQPEVENGEIAAVIIDNQEAVLKRIYRNNGQIVLQSENPNYPPIFAPPAHIRIIGRLSRTVIKY
ncbi:MAG: LexA family transcriptional regulator [Desulfitobacteriaceae bacterium]|jgi:repressor LexA|nr:LexA family transcriptional regulator [Desulfitobacteriaceae bacterium]